MGLYFRSYAGFCEGPYPWATAPIIGNILGHNSINLDLATNYYLCECLMTFDSSLTA